MNLDWNLSLNLSSLYSYPFSALRFRPQQAPGSSFAQQVSETHQIDDNAPHIQSRASRLYCAVPKERQLTCCSGVGSKYVHQSVYAWYTEDSTPEDPIVQIAGKSEKGDYQFLCHINDINPSSASYAELAVLFDHLTVTGQATKRPGSSSGHVLPNGIESGNVLQRRNYLALIQNHTTSRWFSPDIRSSARDLADTYLHFMDSKSQSKKADTVEMSMTEDLLNCGAVSKHEYHGRK